MARNHTPKYRRQRRKSGDLAFVELGRTRHYLGRYNTPQSHEAYHRLVAEWHAHASHPRVGFQEITVTEIIARFTEHAERYYRKPDGTPTGELENFKTVLGPLGELYGHTPGAGFSPRRLKAVRQKLIDRGLARKSINGAIRRLRHVFKWAVGEELIPSAVLESLRAVAPLKRGRTEAREPGPVRPVHCSDIKAVRPFVSRQVWTLIQIQFLTGARSGELLPMRSIDIDLSGNVWVYSPSDHKNSYREHERKIYLGPRAQKLLRPFMEGRPLISPLFSPREAEKERLERRHLLRVTPLNHGNVPGSNRKRGKCLREADETYTTRSYARAIRRACKAAGIKAWSPHRLRHTRATEVRREFGLEVSRVICGHRTTASTELYAEIDEQRAVEIMARIG